MAEGLLEGVLGGEEERKNPVKAGAEPIAAAIATNLVKDNPEVAAATVEFLRKQTELLEAQRKSVEDEHEFFDVEWGPRLLALRLRTGFQTFLALIATMFGVGLAIVVYEAVQSRSVVIDSFDAPPALAPSGLSGKVVAAGLLDVLTQIQAATRTSAERRSLSNAWTNEIAIEVPETGVSLGELERMIKTRFGHDQHIDGDLVQTEKGSLALTVRGTGILPKTFDDEDRNLDKLLIAAGEYLYSQSQPGLWMNYLVNSGRNDDAIHFAESSYRATEASEQPYVLNYWGNAILAKGSAGAMEEALPLWREAVRLKPDYWAGYGNIMLGLGGLGHEEEMIQVGKQMMKIAGGRPGKAPEISYVNYDQIVWNLPAARTSILADIASHGGIGTTTLASGALSLAAAWLEVLMHDPETAALRLKTTRVDEKDTPSVAFAAFSRALLAEEQDDLPTAAMEWDAFAVAGVDPGFFSQSPYALCYSAVTYQKAGQPQKADAALNIVGARGFVDCFRFRGDVLDLRGDWAGAQNWYEKAVKLGPSLPAGYYSWGVALAKRGDLAAAAAKLQLANQKGPHWADPLKAWGDVLVKQGKAKDALAKYDAALEYAPNWKQLKEARETLAKQKS